jgi:exodeoxyribonuclease V alpha subunit
MMQEHEQLVGVTERIVFRHEKDNWTVLNISTDEGEKITVIGNLPLVRPGERLELFGSWQKNRRFGRQFKVSRFRILPPSKRQGFIKYLSSGLIKGIGPEFAARLVEKFDDKVLEVIDREPEKLLEVDGIGEKRLKMIRQAWCEQRQLRDVMLFFQTHGIGPALAAKIFRVYGNRTLELIRENPYRLSDEVFGIGFRTADKLAASLGVGADSDQRAEAGLKYILNNVTEDGHVYYPQRLLLEKASSELGLRQEALTRSLSSLEKRGELIIEAGDGDKAVFLERLYLFETKSAARLLTLVSSPSHALVKDLEEKISSFERRGGLNLSAGQRHAVSMALSHPISVITGGPGTGKTTIIRTIVEIASAAGLKIFLCAPTGRAAKRLSQVCGREAQTIHRLLQFDPAGNEFKANRFLPLPVGILVVDEMSMVDIDLFYHLLEAFPTGGNLILVGDADQLPSVGPGNVLRDLIESGLVPTAKLTEIFRQALSSRIVLSAHRLLKGQLPLLDNQPDWDFFFLEKEDPEEILETIKSLAATRLPSHYGLRPLDDLQVLSPMHRGLLGVENLNRELQRLFNPQAVGSELAPGDKVMQLRNNYQLDVYNGDIGRVIDSIHDEESKLIVEFDGRRVVYGEADSRDLSLAYACSIHKAQGSEYPAVVIPLHTQHYLMLQRNLLYTAVTRGRRLVVLVGSRRALQIAVSNNRSRERYTLLHRRLRSKAAV